MSSTAQTILITGATSGIGRAAALHLARQGHRVIATGRNEGALARLREAVDVQIHTLPLDVTDAQSIAAAVSAVDDLTAGHGVDVLVNNAGYGQAGPLEELPDEQLRAQFDTNVFGLMAVTRAFLPRMRERGGGRIVNISSIGGRVTFPLFGAYHASKYAVEALSDALRMELAPFGIQVVLIEPGPIRTEFGNRSVREVEQLRREDSPYAPVYAQAQQIQASVEARAAGPKAVVSVIERAIDARRPSARYVAPASNRVVVWLLSRLPTSWVDGLLRRFLGLTRERLVEKAPLRLTTSRPVPDLR